MELDCNRLFLPYELVKKPIWNSCNFCKLTFKELHDFTRHLRTEHCTVEGGSFVCRYGYNSVCNSLPLEGVSDLDYADHIMKHHAFSSDTKDKRKQSSCSTYSVSSDQSGSGWISVSASQNLAAVLNDPGRGKQRDLFTKLYGADFTETPLSQIPLNPHLPIVTRAHFDTYLRKISKRHRRHNQIISSDLLQFPTQRRRNRSFDRQHEPLDVPSIFLKPDFDLSKPEFFFAALPFAQSGITVDGAFRQNSKILQEKLTHSLDQVEMRIAEQVSEKSETFFAAMTSHDTLMDQLGKTLCVVRNLRARIATVDQRVAVQTFKILQFQQRKANYLAVLQKLKLMRTVHQTQPQIQILLSAPDYVAALELIVTSQEILGHELAAVHCFRHLGPQLSEITRLIDKMMASEFESYSTRDLNRPINDDFDVLEQEKLVCIMLGMLRHGGTGFISKYQTEAFTAIRALVKQVVLERLAESDCEVQGPVQERVQALPLNHFLILMETVTSQVAKLLTKIKVVHDVMLNTIEMAAGARADGGNDRDHQDGFSFLSSKDFDKAKCELEKLLTAVCSFSHEECAKLLSNVTALDSASANQVCELGQVVDRFARECTELSSGRATAALRAAFLVAAGKFVGKFHAERKEKLTAQLESETWRPCEVTSALQQFMSNISADGSSSIPIYPETSSGASDTILLVGKEKYAVVGVTVSMIRQVADYSRLAGVFPQLSHQIMRDILELLNLFNSKSCQLVLGAGAMQTAGLKTITTTNLVLTSRALQLLISILPHLKSHFEGVMYETISKSGKSSIASLVDEVEAKMADHIGQLHSKVVLIVSTVVNGELSSWSVKPPVPSQTFRNISRHLIKLHEAVSGILPAYQVEKLYRQINDKFKSALRDHLRKLNIVNNGGPQHGTVTSELIFYVDMLKKLNVLPNEDLSDNSLTEIWSRSVN